MKSSLWSILLRKLSFRLPAYDSALVGLVGQIRICLMRNDSILGQIRYIPVVHDGTIRQISEPKILETTMKTEAVTMVINAEWFRTTNVEEFAAYIYTLSNSFIEIAKERLFEFLSKTTTGNTLDAQGNFWDSLIEAVRKDTAGKPFRPLYTPRKLSMKARYI